MDQLYLLDGTNIFYRCFFAPFRDLSVKCSCVYEGAVNPHPDCPRCEGTGREPTKATWLFTRQLLKLIRDKKPKYLAVVFDGNRSALRRRAIYPAYKANRREKPAGAKPQLRRIKQIIKTLGITVIQCEGYEADDALATIAHRLASPLLEVIIVSRDKDMAQLCVNPDIFRSDPLTAEWLAKKTAGAKFGIKTRQLIDYFILTGDAGDNVPGVGGFGEKTAAKYLKRYKDLGEIILAATMGHLPLKLAQNICKANASGWLELSRKLITLDTDVAIVDDVTPGGLEVPRLDLRKAEPIFRRLGFKNL